MPALFLLLVLLFPTALMAQRPDAAGAQIPTGSIQGFVFEQDGQTGIVAATVSLWSARDSSLVTGAITDASGRFLLERIRPGAYYVRISFVGFTSEKVSGVVVRPGALDVNLGSISLQPDAQQLAEIEVQSERAAVEIGIDRTSYAVAEQPMAQSGNASEVLQAIPSVEVDADGNVSLRGNTNVAILLNGRPAPVSAAFLAAFLQQIPASTIDRIEVIPNPSARYEPDGMAGMINIVLKERASIGLNGSVIVSGSTRSNFNGSASIGAGVGKWNLFANYGYRYDPRDIIGTTMRIDRLLNPTSSLDQTNGGEDVRSSHLLSTTAEYAFSRQTTLSLRGVGSFGGDRSDAITNSFRSLQDGSFVRAYRRDALEEETGNSFDTGVTLRRVIQASENEWTAETTFSRSSEIEDTDYSELNLSPTGIPMGIALVEQTLMDELRQNAVARFDLVRPFASGKMEAGYRGSWQWQDSELDAFDNLSADGTLRPNPFVANTFDFFERIQALYGTYGRTMGVFSVQAGLRAEHSLTRFDQITQASTFRNDFFAFFPSGFILYRPDFSNQVRLSYTRRINRPRSRQLNPFVDYSDRENLRGGNPALRPEYTNSLELSATRFTRSTSVSITPFYRYTTDVIRRLQEIQLMRQPNGDTLVVTNATFANLATDESYGADFVFTYRRGQDFNMLLSLNAYQQNTEGGASANALGSNAFGWGGRGSFQWTARPGLSISAFAFYRAPMKTEQGRIRAFQSSDLSVRQALFSNQASLTLRVNDVFDQSGFTFITDLPQFYQEGTRRWQQRTVTLSFQYNFGQQQNGNQRNRRPVTDEGSRGGDDFDF